MLEIMRDNAELLGLETDPSLFDSTLQRTRDMLRNGTVDLQVTMGDWIDAWGATCEVQLTNKAGHKFPSGYPARRAWIEVKATQNGEILWHSGGWENGNITGVDEGGLEVFEPHHSVIDDPMEVQIYELVAADVEGNPTNVLERAASSLKDNRLTPKGFSYDHPVYDTTRVEGLALNDPQFNVGQGRHTVQYEMATPPNATYAPIDMEIKVWYQAMPPRWLEPMFAFEDSTIQAFQALFEAQGAAPELVADTAFTVNLIGDVADVAEKQWGVFPNPTWDGVVRVDVPERAIGSLWELYDAKGSRVASGWTRGNQRLQLPDAKGTYLLKWTLPDGESVTRKVIRR